VRSRRSSRKIQKNGLTKTYQVGDVPGHTLLPSWRIDPATTGDVRITGRDLAGTTNAERDGASQDCGWLCFQTYNLLPTLSAEDNIRIVQYIAGRSTAFDTAF
jgi:ABC-type lipoprotein export system ATPase subunit